MLRASSASRKLLLAALLLITPPATWGLDSDRSQPIHIEADRVTLSEKGNLSIYEGNVRLRQGSLHLQGDHMTVLLADNEADKIILTGKPATLRQNQGDTVKHAEADNIEYSASNENVILLGNARVWQTSGEEFRGERIVFNLNDNTVNAGGTTTRDRVHITLPPKNKPDDKQ
jgi:lipopolysaccharide export system protein LptA